MRSNQLLCALLFLLAVGQTGAGPILYGSCVAMCTALCAGGSAVAGVFTAGVATVIIGPGCFPSCMAGCAITGIAPTP